MISLLLLALIVATIDCRKKKRTPTTTTTTTITTTTTRGPGENFVIQLRHDTASFEEMLKTFTTLSSKDKEYVILNVDVTIADEILSNVPRNSRIEQVCFDFFLTKTSPYRAWLRSSICK